MASKQVATVTGGNKGIGLSIVRALCRQFDGDVYLTARDEVRGRGAVETLKSEGLNPKFHVLDVSDHKSVQTFKEFLVNNYGGVDVFVHNAGIMYLGGDPTPPYEQAVKTISVNYTNTVDICDTMLPVMKSNGRMCILASQMGKYAFSECSSQIQQVFRSPDVTMDQVNQKMKEFVEATKTNSCGKMGFPTNAYAVSKLGVMVYTRILGKRAENLSQDNVVVNCCCPGFVTTDLTGNAGYMTPDEGAVTPMFVAMLPKDAATPNGEFFQNKRVVKWY